MFEIYIRYFLSMLVTLYQNERYAYYITKYEFISNLNIKMYFYFE